VGNAIIFQGEAGRSRAPDSEMHGPISVITSRRPIEKDEEEGR